MRDRPGGVLRHRVGQALCFLPEIENIDANKANTTFIGHSYFVDGNLVLRDLEDIVQRDYVPGTARALPGQQDAGENTPTGK